MIVDKFGSVKFKFAMLRVVQREKTNSALTPDIQSNTFLMTNLND